MDRRIKVFLGFAIAALFVVLSLPSRSSEPDTPDAPDTPAALPEAGTLIAAAPRPATATQLAAQQARRQALAWGRDPFAAARRPATAPDPARDERQPGADLAAPAQVARMRLTGISVGGSERWAIIDRQLVRQGDELASGFQVARIERRSVTLLREDEEVVLNLGDG